MSSRLVRAARMTRKQLVLFALVSAMLNGIITASVGAWLAQTYSAYQSRRLSIENIAHLVYERRTRAGMVASAIRRDAQLDEIQHRKRAYDEAYVDWNKNVMLHLFAIREAAGELKISTLEPYFEDGLVAAMADIDRCITKAYDARVAGQDAKAPLDACRVSALQQFVLDCGATFTNELYKLTRLSFAPWSSERKQIRDIAQEKISSTCTRREPVPTTTPGAAVAPTPAVPTPSVTPVVPPVPPAEAAGATAVTPPATSPSPATP